jgi:hypothetical protein
MRQAEFDEELFCKIHGLNSNGLIEVFECLCECNLKNALKFSWRINLQNESDRNTSSWFIL